MIAVTVGVALVIAWRIARTWHKPEIVVAERTTTRRHLRAWRRERAERNPLLRRLP